MDDLPERLTRLETRVGTLEQRVNALEHPSDALCPAAAEAASPPANTEGKRTASLAGGAFPVLGKAMLGIAGAYLLRAVAESSALPNAAVGTVAIAYALGWLVWASRVEAGDWLAGTTYACTSALILAPMLWELTLRFNVLPAWVAAVVVGGFAVAGSALAWKRDLGPVLWVANGTAVATSLTLAIATRQMGPFLAVLLTMVLIGEYGAARGRDAGVRVLVALAADVAVWAEIYIYSGPESARAAYPPLGMAALLLPGVLLLLISGGGLTFRTVLKGRTITLFDTMETMIAFLLAACGLIYFGPAASAVWLGALCLLLSGLGYAAALLRFSRAEAQRNYRVFATWSAALLLAGSLLCLPRMAQAAWLSVAAIAAIFASMRMNRLALELHGVVFMLAAAWESGLLNSVLNTLAGTLPGLPGLSVCVASAGAVLCYVEIKPSPQKSWMRTALSIVFAALAMGVLAAFVVQGLAGLTSLKVIPEAHHVAFIRTLTVCAAAIGLAYSGAHWRRMELTRIGYATLVLIAVKLVLEDLQHGHLAFIAGSIFLFAITLIVVPRVARTGQRV